MISEVHIFFEISIFRRNRGGWLPPAVKLERSGWQIWNLRRKLGAIPPAEVEGVRSTLLQGKLYFTFAKRQHESCELLENNFMTSCPSDPGSILETSRNYGNRLQDHGTSKHLIFRNHDVHQQSEKFDNIATDTWHLRSDWEAIVDRYGIYIENHQDQNRH